MPQAGQSSAIQVFLLGSFRVLVRGRQLPDDVWRRRKARQLFKCLLSRPQRRLSKDQAMELFWPESAAESASSNLRTTVHALRLALSSSDRQVIVEDRESYFVDPAADVWVDADAFESLVTQAEAAEDPLPLLEDANSRYAGEFLPEDLYEEWASERRDQLKRRWTQLQFRLARVREERNQPERAIPPLERLLQADACDELAAQALMRLLGRQGRRAAALRVYQRLTRALQEDLGVEPSEASIELHHQIASAYRAEATTSASLKRPEPSAEPREAYPLPVQPTRLVGREREIELVASRLRSADVRLVTLIGPGGVGKSRLAVAVAETIRSEFEDGVTFVDLAPIRDAALVIPTIARTLGIRQLGARSPMEQLRAFAARSQLLLLLDNFEQVVEAGIDIVEVLRACPRVKVLATSREPLRLRWEHKFNVAPLDVPDPSAAPALDELVQVPALMLLVERAQASDAAFALSANNAPDLIRLCSRLDGLPLAIELAAANLHALPPQLLLTYIEHRLDLPGGPRDAPVRHQSLAAAFAWSYDLLTEAEQVLLRRLSVFVGGCGLQAINAVCAPESQDGLVPTIGALIDRSLLRHDDPSRGEVRFRMLETVREFAREHLSASSERDEVRRRHAAYYTVLAERAESELIGPRQATWFEELQREHDNIRAALRWCLQSAEAELGLRLGGAIARFWLTRGYLSEGRRWLDELLGMASTVWNRATRAKVLTMAAILAGTQADAVRGTALVSEALALWREVGDRSGIARSLIHLGALVVVRGDYEAALRCYQEANQIWEELNDTRGVGLTLVSMGVCERHLGRPHNAEVLSKRAIELLLQAGDEDAASRASLTLTYLAHERGDDALALRLLREDLQRFSTLRDVEEVSECLHLLARIIGRTHPRASTCLRGADQALLDSIEFVSPPGVRVGAEDEISRLRSMLSEAEFQAAWREGQAMTLDQAVAYGMRVLADVLDSTDA